LPQTERQCRPGNIKIINTKALKKKYSKILSMKSYQCDKNVELQNSNSGETIDMPQNISKSVSSITDSHFSPSKQDFDEAISHYQSASQSVSQTKEGCVDQNAILTDESLAVPKPMANNCLRYSMEFNRLKSHNSNIQTNSFPRRFFQDTVQLTYSESSDSDAL